MARIRTIKPEFPQSETMGKLSRERFKKATITMEIRRAVCLRYGPKERRVEARCHFCAAAGSIHWYDQERGKSGYPALLDLEFDHLTPEFRGGPTTADNIVLSCRLCNRSRGRHRAIPRHLEAA